MSQSPGSSIVAVPDPEPASTSGFVWNPSTSGYSLLRWLSGHMDASERKKSVQFIRSLLRGLAEDAVPAVSVRLRRAADEDPADSVVDRLAGSREEALRDVAPDAVHRHVERQAALRPVERVDERADRDATADLAVHGPDPFARLVADDGLHAGQVGGARRVPGAVLLPAAQRHLVARLESHARSSPKWVRAGGSVPPAPRVLVGEGRGAAVSRRSARGCRRGR